MSLMVLHSCYWTKTPCLFSPSENFVTLVVTEYFLCFIISFLHPSYKGEYDFIFYLKPVTFISGVMGTTLISPLPGELTFCAYLMDLMLVINGR